MRGSPGAFAERLSLLVSSGQVTPMARELTEQVVAGVEKGLHIRLVEDTAAVFVTHLAVALTRVERGEPSPVQSAAVVDEIRDRPVERDLMRRLLDRCGERLGRPVPRTEVDYMTVHACALSEA